MSTSIIKDSIKLTTSKVITLTISMLTAMLLSRFRTLEEYGTYSQILMVISIANSLLMLGLPNSINYFLARSESIEEKQHYLSAYYTLTTILSCVVGIILMFITPLLTTYFTNPLIKSLMYFMAVYPWVQIILSSIDQILVVYNKIKILMYFRISNSLFLLLLIVVSQILNISFYSYMIFFTIGQIVFALVTFLINRNLGIKLKINLDYSLIMKILKFSLPIGLATAVGTFHVEFDKLFIGIFYNTEQLAIYANSSREIPVTIITSSLIIVLMPRLIKSLKNMDYKNSIYLWGESISLSYIIICFFTTGLFVYAPQVISLLYSDKYIPGVDIFRIYCLLMLFKSTYFGMILNSIGKTKLIFFSSIIALVTDIILNFIFYKIFGFIGPALSTLFTTTIVALFQLAATSKSLKLKLSEVFPWGELLKISLVNIALGLFFFSIKIVLPLQIYTGDILESIILGMIWGILYFAMMLKSIKRKSRALNI